MSRVVCIGSKFAPSECRRSMGLSALYETSVLEAAFLDIAFLDGTERVFVTAYETLDWGRT